VSDDQRIQIFINIFIFLILCLLSCPVKINILFIHLKPPPLQGVDKSREHPESDFRGSLIHLLQNLLLYRQIHGLMELPVIVRRKGQFIEIGDNHVPDTPDPFHGGQLSEENGYFSLS